jgi:hypothetical protein
MAGPFNYYADQTGPENTNIILPDLLERQRRAWG